MPRSTGATKLQAPLTDKQDLWKKTDYRKAQLFTKKGRRTTLMSSVKTRLSHHKGLKATN